MKLLDMMKEAHKGRAPNSVEYFRELKQMTQKEQDNVMREYEEWKTIRQGKQFKSVREEKKWQLKDIRNLTNIKLKRL